MKPGKLGHGFEVFIYDFEGFRTGVLRNDVSLCFPPFSLTVFGASGMLRHNPENKEFSWQVTSLRLSASNKRKHERSETVLTGPGCTTSFAAWIEL